MREAGREEEKKLLQSHLEGTEKVFFLFLFRVERG